MDRSSLPKCQTKISSSSLNGELNGLLKEEQEPIDFHIPDFWLDEIALSHDTYREKEEELRRIFQVISLCAAMEYSKRLGLDKARSAPIKWYNGCDRVIPVALRYLADNERPSYGEESFNSMHLHQLADDLERTKKSND